MPLGGRQRKVLELPTAAKRLNRRTDASATVKFTVDKRPTTVFIDLVKIKNNWFVAEIIWPDAPPENLHSLCGQVVQERYADAAFAA